MARVRIIFRARPRKTGNFLSAKHQNRRQLTIFVNIEGLRPCLRKLSDGAFEWALMTNDPPNAKETAQTAAKIATSENQAFGSFWSF